MVDRGACNAPFFHGSPLCHAISTNLAYILSDSNYRQIGQFLPGDIMAVSGINNYRNTLYQWQNNQLKNTGAGTSGSSAALETLFGGSASMTSQISSMVELTKYAMEAMGVSSDSRVTFSQISKYREQLQSEFNAGVRKGIEESGISDISAMSFAIDKNGAITAISQNSSDRKAAQAWLDANPSFAQEIFANLPEDAFESRSDIAFRLSSTGRITVTHITQTEIQDYLNKNGDLAENARARMKTAGIDIEFPVELKFDDEGNLIAECDNADAINAWLRENRDIEEAVKKQLDKSKVDPSAVSLRLGDKGALQITVNDAEINAIQAGLDKSSDAGLKIRQGLENLGIDKNITFSIQVDAAGNLQVISDHPDAAKIQKFFDDNPELVKKYRQIETLAGIDDARKAMQVSPSAMRKRVQVESMVSWWAGSGNATSYFGNYNDGLSLLSGLNLSV